MGWPKLLVLVRHAQSLGNTLSIDERTAYECSAHAYPLTALGREQASITGKWLWREFGDFDVRYTSYYARARETMSLLYPNAKEALVDSRLAEVQHGIFHVLTHGDIGRLLPWEMARKEREGNYHFLPLGGENWPNVELRIHSFLDALARDCDGKKVLIVVHGHWLILFQRLINHFSIEEAMRRYREHVIENASVTVYRGEGPWYAPWSRRRLVRDGDTVVPWKVKLEERPATPA
jgi:broad specificity phosphatase PhoE